MPHKTIEHETVTLTRTYPASVSAVFAAWEDPAARRVWGVPFDGVEIRHAEADFSVGGRDVSLCSMGGEPAFEVHGRYYDIQPNARIVFTETIIAEGQTQAVCLVSLELEGKGPDTDLTLTVQSTGIDTPGTVGEVEGGWTAALDNLGKFLARETVAT